MQKRQIKIYNQRNRKFETIVSLLETAFVKNYELILQSMLCSQLYCTQSKRKALIHICYTNKAYFCEYKLLSRRLYTFTPSGFGLAPEEVTGCLFFILCNTALCFHVIPIMTTFFYNLLVAKIICVAQPTPNKNCCVKKKSQFRNKFWTG